MKKRHEIQVCKIEASAFRWDPTEKNVCISDSGTV